MPKAKFSITHSDGQSFEKEADFGIVFTGEMRDGNSPYVEMNATTLNGGQVLFILATFLTMVAKINPKIIEDASKLMEQALKNPDAAEVVMDVTQEVKEEIKNEIP